MSDQTTNEERAIVKITNYMEAAPVKARFAQMMGEHGAATYIANVLIAVRESEALQKCKPESIYTQALRAGTLRLSVDPGIGQAYLVPFKDRATLIIGYKGLYDMAVRTGRYRYINVGKVFEGEEVVEDRYSGFHSLSGHKTSDKVIGWLGAFEMWLPMLGGKPQIYAKTFYMTIEEIADHASAYSASYASPSSPWNSKRERPKMERKTVLRLMLKRWGYIDPVDAAMVQEIESESPDSESINMELGALTSTIDGRVEEDEKPGTLADLGFPENENQETGKPSKPIELIEPLADWAVGQAAKRWNVSKKDAAQSIAAKKLGRMSKTDFLAWLEDPK